jgi:hypothetical protein
LNCPTINAAERRKDESVKMCLLVPHPSMKEGKQTLYFLPNYLHVFNEKMKKRSKEVPPVSPDDITLILIKVLSERQSAYHHISLKTSLNYPLEDYNCFDERRNWKIKSIKNKTKTATFKLEQRRNCTLNVSQNGTVMISIECTTNPFKLHTDEGIAELFVCCGQILNILQEEAGYRLNVVPPVVDWYIVQFDSDKTISIAELKKDYPDINWHSRAGFTMRSAAGSFRMYVKEMPEKSSSLRTETIASFKEPEKFVKKIKEIARGDKREQTPEDIIPKLRDYNKSSSNNDTNSYDKASK